MTKIILALGGNIGNVPDNFQKAKELLTCNQIQLIGESNIIITAPVDCPDETPDFYNMVLLAQSDIKPLELLNLCQKIEQQLGRPKVHGINLSRTIDIDIITYGSERIALDNLIIPHPRAIDRTFVMEPIANLIEQNLIKREDISVLYER